MTEQPESQAQAEQQAMPEIPESELPGAVTAMLFAAAEPARIHLLARTTGYDIRTVRTTLENLAPELARLGLILQWTDHEHVQLATNPYLSTLVRRFLGIERTSKLSAAALEVLAIIGYQQPVTRPEIDSVRGVDSSAVIQTLVARELIAPVGRLPGPGNPVQYGTTGEFLRLFGLTSMGDLPELPDELVQQLEGSQDHRPADGTDPSPSSG